MAGVWRLLLQTGFWLRLETALRPVFAAQPGWSEQAFEAQMSVVRGQIVNLLAAFKRRLSPAELTRLPPLLLHRRTSTGQKVVFVRQSAASAGWPSCCCCCC